jgi:hypothetical protein
MPRAPEHRGAPAAILTAFWVGGLMPNSPRRSAPSEIACETRSRAAATQPLA